MGGAAAGTDQGAQILEQAAAHFGVSVDRLSPMTGGHYAQVYEWVRDGRGCVLKISPTEGDDDLRATRSMLAWLDYLAGHGAPVVRPLVSRAGNLVEPVESGGRLYLVTAAEKITGARAETLPRKQWDSALIRKLGRVIGRCHALAQSYSPSDPALRRPNWNQMTNCFNPVYERTATTAFIPEKRARIMRIIQALPTDRESCGLAHLDIHFANFIVDSKTREVALIDFDDCAYGWYAMDVAMLLFDWMVLYRDGPRDHGQRFLDALLSGYRAEKEFPAFWVAQLPVFLKLLEIGVYTMLAPEYDPAACDDTWVKTFMQDRERRIREDIPYLE